jgi:oxygen-dependent protoporphyrinogen oxidase
VRIVVVGGGIAGLAAARRLETLVPDAELVLVEKDGRLGGKIRTEHIGELVVEAAPDSFLSRKERGIGLCEEIGLADELVGRRPEHAGTFVRRGRELVPLPTGLTGMIPTDLDALTGSELLSAEGRERLAAEVDLPPAVGVDDESIAAFASRRLGREAYEAIVEPLATGIYGGDGEQLSLGATFPALRALELEHGSVLRGLAAQAAASTAEHPPFVSLRSGMETLVRRLAESLERTRIVLGLAVARVDRHRGGYAVPLADGELLAAEGVVLAVPAFSAASLVPDLDADLAAAHAEIPYASSTIVTLAYREADLGRSLDGYGYVVPRTEGSDVLACTWTSSKWEGRAPAGEALVRVYAGRFGRTDVTHRTDDELVELASAELALVGIVGEPRLTRVHRWQQGMPQYTLGHLERLERIDALLSRHRGLAVAGAAYRGVGIPDCIRSGEDAAEAVALALERVAG